MVYFDGFDNLIKIGGILRVRDLRGFEGLNNLLTIEGDLIFEDTRLSEIEGLVNLTEIGGQMIIRNNGSLENLDNFENLTHVGDIEILGNPDLPTAIAEDLADRLINAGFAGNITIEGNKP